jgi:UDP-glucose 4-epimerase
MKALVTGAAGFVGSSISDRLLEGGYDVIGIDRFIDYYPREIKEKNLVFARSHDQYTFVEQSLVDCSLAPLLDGVDYIFHQAAQAGVRASWGDEFRIYSDNNVFATQRLLEAAREANVKKMVYASSSSVYGDTDDLPMREDSPTRPHSPYGVTKLAGEHLTTLYWRNFRVPTVSLRYFTVYGPRQRPDMAFNRFIEAVLRDEEIPLYGDGKQSRDFTFIADIVSANIAAAQSDVCGTVFNIGGGSRTTMNEVIEMIGEIIGRTPKVNRSEVQKGDVKHTAADTSRASSEIGFAPEVGIREGLTSQVEWQKKRLGL